MKYTYIEGSKAAQNFEEAMKTIFQAPKPLKSAKKKLPKAATRRKSKNSDKD